MASGSEGPTPLQAYADVLLQRVREWQVYLSMHGRRVLQLAREEGISGLTHSALNLAALAWKMVLVKAALVKNTAFHYLQSAVDTQEKSARPPLVSRRRSDGTSVSDESIELVDVPSGSASPGKEYLEAPPSRDTSRPASSAGFSSPRMSRDRPTRPTTPESALHQQRPPASATPPALPPTRAQAFLPAPTTHRPRANSPTTLSTASNPSGAAGGSIRLPSVPDVIR
eukprot:comp18236_c0_seq1/m.19196 comp18236_c0_seq1/g.19196  ORF comp18236_c0_seq1/g.19196 comp18236_c0_seq1/m.19196 type:complete len:227 (-) comp18236_c0_seq1:293-973(-)